MIGQQIIETSLEVPVDVGVPKHLYCQKNFAVTLSTSQAETMKMLVLGLASTSKRCRCRANHPDGKVVDSASDAVRYILDQISCNLQNMNDDDAPSPKDAPPELEESLTDRLKKKRK